MALREKDYWDKHYQSELDNFVENGDEGEVWFGHQLARKIVNYIVKEVHLASTQRVSVLDIGCGNGQLLGLLIDKFEEVFNKSRKLCAVGLDYSDNSIQLATKILEAKGYGDNVSFEKCDFLVYPEVKERVERLIPTKVDYIVDKGTFDAICLIASNTALNLDAAKEQYMRSIYEITKEGTIFILASCNHTESELTALFDIQLPSKRRYEILGRIATPTFKFGGGEGTQVTCLLIKIKN